MKFLTKLVCFMLLCNIAHTEDRLDFLKKACSDPGSVHNQIPPSDLKVACDDTVFTWVLSDDEDVAFKNRRKMCTSVTTSKPNVNAAQACEDCGVPDSQFKCQGYKEIQKCVRMTFGVTCEQILAMESIVKWCVDHIDEEVAINEEILNVKETGKKKPCGYRDLAPTTQTIK